MPNNSSIPVQFHVKITTQHTLLCVCNTHIYSYIGYAYIERNDSANFILISQNILNQFSYLIDSPTLQRDKSNVYHLTELSNQCSKILTLKARNTESQLTQLVVFTVKIRDLFLIQCRMNDHCYQNVKGLQQLTLCLFMTFDI